MSLKTDYKDYAWDGNRQYTITTGSGGVTSGCTIVDNTNYTTQGDTFAAADINETNAAVNALTNLIHKNNTATEVYGGDLLYLRSDKLNLYNKSGTSLYSDTPANMATALSNGLGLSNCAFYHQFGVKGQQISGGWNAFTSTNIKVPASSLTKGTYLVIVNTVMTTYGDGYAEMYWHDAIKGGEVRHYGLQQRGSTGLANGRDGVCQASFLWAADGKTAFAGWPEIYSTVAVKPWIAGVIIVKLNNGTFTAK